MILETDKAYLAGIIDGEGTICIHKESKGYVHCVLRVGMVDPTCIMWAYNLTKLGSVNTYETRTQPLTRPKYLWSLNGNNALTIINLVFPYLLLKRKQAELFIELMSIRGKKLHFPRQLEIAEEMKKLNARGMR